MIEADIVRASLVPLMLIGTAIIWYRRKFVVGRLLMLIGILHLSGVWVGRAAVQQIVAGGFVGAADSAVGKLPERAPQELVVWFALWGLWTIFLGQLAVMLERHHIAPPRWFGWQLIAVNLIAAALIPKGGFWWVLLPAGLMALYGRQHAAQPSGATHAGVDRATIGRHRSTSDDDR